MLHGDDLFDMAYVLNEARHLLCQPLALFFQLLCKLVQIGKNPCAACIGSEILGNSRLVLLQQLHQRGQLSDSRFAELVGDDGGGDIHAVQHVADVVEDAGRDFRHPRQAGELDQTLLRLGQFGMGLVAGDNLLAQLLGAQRDPNFQVAFGFG